MKHCFVTGCAGFIGSHLVDRLLAEGHTVAGYDNFCTGREQNLEGARRNPRFALVRGDLLDLNALTDAMRGADLVYHLAANADVRFGIQHPRKDLEQNTIGTFHVLEAMRANAVRHIVFSSTGAAYGEPEVFPTPETAPIPVQTSLYGASKMACEGMIEAYCAGFGFRTHIFRFVAIVGERYPHGHILDFCRKLRANPREIEVLGNGKQRKSSLYIQDCIDAIQWAVRDAQDSVNIFNLGTNEYCTVDESLTCICNHLGLNPQRRYTGGERGWIGDNPFVFLDIRKICALGWQPKLTIRESVLRTVDYLQSNPDLLEERR